jgi:hypothetical protein
VHGQLRAASYDEWGWFLAALFRADPNAKAGPYKNEPDFHRKTEGAYSDGREGFRADPRPSEPDCPQLRTRGLARHPRGWPSEPEPEYASTAPVTDAMLPDAERTLARIDDTLAGCWVNTISPA